MLDDDDDDDDYDDEEEDDGCNNHNDATTIMMDFFDHEPSIREKIEVGNQELSFLRILLCCFVACCLQRAHTRRKQRVVGIRGQPR